MIQILQFNILENITHAIQEYLKLLYIVTSPKTGFTTLRTPSFQFLKIITIILARQKHQIFLGNIGYITINNLCKSMLNLYTKVLNAMKQQKNFEYVKDKKVIEISGISFDNQLLCRVYLLFSAKQLKQTNWVTFLWKLEASSQSDQFQQNRKKVQSQNTKRQYGKIYHKCHKVISVSQIVYENTFKYVINKERESSDAFFHLNQIYA